MRIQRAPLVALLVAVACGGAQNAARPEERSPTTCSDLVERYREALADGSGRCESAADCAVYGGLDPDNVCGGLTDADTARTLTDIARQSDEAGCPRPGYSCPPIVVQCTDGFCR